MADLTDREKAILQLEGLWWQYPGAKETQIRKQFGVSATRYYQELNTILDNPSAVAHDPLGVKRLLRIRAQRQLSRRTTRRAARH